MGKVEAIESQVRELSAEELTRFRAWFAEFDGELWDRKLEADVRKGKLDTLAEKALQDHASGKSTKL